MAPKHDPSASRRVRNVLELGMHGPVSDEDMSEAGIPPELRSIIQTEAARLRETFESGARGPARTRAAAVAAALAADGQLERPTPPNRDDARAIADRVRNGHI